MLELIHRLNNVIVNDRIYFLAFHYLTNQRKISIGQTKRKVIHRFEAVQALHELIDIVKVKWTMIVE
jgi:hypothetical protein